MEQALELARNGLGSVSPNPPVGAVVVRDGEILSTGFHAKFGGAHAEVEAISGIDCSGADLYVTLEPCCHFGKTPPCTDLIISSGIRRVFCGMKDPYHEVSGRGVEALMSAGIDVFVVDGDFPEVRRFYQPYIKSILTGLPFVTLKAGLSLDGKIALSSGESKWITSKDARNDARLQRGYCDAVLVGSGTVLADNPHLASPTGGSLLRVVVDRKLSLDTTLEVFRDEDVFVATTELADASDRNLFRSHNIEFGVFGKDSLDITSLLTSLFDRGVRHVFVEGGSAIHSIFLNAFARGEKVVDRVLLYFAPLVIGVDGLPFFTNNSPGSLSDIKRFSSVTSTVIGGDVRVEGFVELL